MPNTALLDRRQIYRPFLERLNPLAPSASVFRQSLVVPREFDPRDSKQPPIYEAFATAAELDRGTQMALVGGIGSGKTTELLLTLERLKRHEDAVNIYIDAAEFTDFLQTNPGAMLAAIGLRLFTRIGKRFGEPSDALREARGKLSALAHGKTEWFEEDPREFENDDGLVAINIPGLMKPRFPALKKQVEEVTELVGTILLPFTEHDSQITVIVDGLDRLIEPARFREFAEQDLRAIRRTKVTVIIAAPLLLWFDKSRFLQDYFNVVRYIPAAATEPRDSGFLKAILKKRRADELMSPASMNTICRFSGGVLRDLLELAQSAAYNAYRDGADKIENTHVRAAVRQLGNRYVAGLGATQRRVIRRLVKDGQFSPDSSDSRELLANRQVLEYCDSGRDYFSVHPALVKALPDPT